MPVNDYAREMSMLNLGKMLILKFFENVLNEEWSKICTIFVGIY